MDIILSMMTNGNERLVTTNNETCANYVLVFALNVLAALTTTTSVSDLRTLTHRCNSPLLSIHSITYLIKKSVDFFFGIW